MKKTKRTWLSIAGGCVVFFLLGAIVEENAAVPLTRDIVSSA